MKKKQARPGSKRDTSWETVGGWYASCVGEKGHYYHRTVVLPGALRLLGKPKSLLDIGCGEGILARSLPPGCEYVGIDASASLIQSAKQRLPQARFVHADAAEPYSLDKKDFEAAAFILSLQNMAHPGKALLAARSHLKKGAKLLLVLNHPCFRIPRQSSWGVDEKNKIQYRRINRYLTPLEIPIQMEPSKEAESSETISFHHSLSGFASFLFHAKFSITTMEEWISDKKSEGSMAKMEDRARKEFPLFLAILARAE